MVYEGMVAVAEVELTAAKLQIDTLRQSAGRLYMQLFIEFIPFFRIDWGKTFYKEQMGINNINIFLIFSE